MPITKILIAVDDSGESMKAARFGFQLAHAIRASIGVLYVIDKGREVVNPDLGIMPEESKNMLQKQATKTVDQFLKMYNGTGEVFRFTPEGEPGKEILNIAGEWGADCIVMGTHQRGKIELLLSGSVMEYVMRHAEIPVIVTPPHMK